MIKLSKHKFGLVREKANLKGDGDILIMNEGSYLVFRWISTQKNDIIVDCLALMFSQLPDDPSFDIFHEETRPGETFDEKELRKKVCKRMLNTFPEMTFKVDKHVLKLEVKNKEKIRVEVNLKNGQINSESDIFKEKAQCLLEDLLKKAKKYS